MQQTFLLQPLFNAATILAWISFIEWPCSAGHAALVTCLFHTKCGLLSWLLPFELLDSSVRLLVENKCLSQLSYVFHVSRIKEITKTSQAVKTTAHINKLFHRHNMLVLAYVVLASLAGTHMLLCVACGIKSSRCMTDSSFVKLFCVVCVGGWVGGCG